MKLYRLNRNLELVDSGDCDLPRALQVLHECYDRGLKKYAAGEEAISETSFGLQTSEQDFIEVTCDGLDSIVVRSDRLFFPSRLSGLFSQKKHLEIPGNLGAITQVVRDYAQLTRERFEQKYNAHIRR
jgi:hypothetical protein